MTEYVAVTCHSCGERIPLDDPRRASMVGADHLGKCGNADPFRFVPAWSIGWPWYWAPEDEKQWTLDVAWMLHTDLADAAPAYQHGGMAKLWHPFQPLVAAEIIRSTSLAS